MKQLREKYILTGSGKFLPHKGENNSFPAGIYFFFKLVLLFFMLSFCSSLSAQTMVREPDSNLIKQNHIRSIGMYEYNYSDQHPSLKRQYLKRFDKMGRPLSKYEFAPGREAYRTEFKYDLSGSLTSSITYDPYDGGFSTTRYNYNGQGQNTERSHFDLYGRLEYRNLIKYDESGKPKESGTYGLSDKFSSKDEYIYDSLGKLTEARLYYTDGKIACKVKYLYDDEGKNNVIIRYDGGDSVPSCKYAYKYDKKGNITEEAMQNMSGELKEKNTYKYDKKGDLVDQVYYASANAPLYRYKFKYRFYRK